MRRTYDAVQLRAHAPAGMERGVLRHTQAGEVLDVFIDATAPQVYAAVKVGGREAYPRAATSVLRASTPRHLEDALARVRHRPTAEPRGAGDVEVEVWNAGSGPADVFVTVLYRTDRTDSAAIEGESGPTPELRPLMLVGVAVVLLSILLRCL